MRKRASPLLLAIILLLCPITVHADDGIPADIKAYCEEIGQEKGICPELLEAIAYTESGFSQYAKNKAGTCFGLCQVYQKFHVDRMKRLGVTDIFDKRGNILVAADLLSELFLKYEDVGAVLMAYNGVKQEAIDKYMETGNLPNYAKRVLNISEEYERLHNK